MKGEERQRRDPQKRRLLNRENNKIVAQGVSYYKVFAMSLKSVEKKEAENTFVREMEIVLVESSAVFPA